MDRKYDYLNHRLCDVYDIYDFMSDKRCDVCEGRIESLESHTQLHEYRIAICNTCLVNMYKSMLKGAKTDEVDFS